MLSKKWAKLLNESDIRGVALEGVEGQDVNLTEDVVEAIGSSFAMWLSNRLSLPAGKLRISIGMDSRLSGPVIKTAVIRGMTKMGCLCFDCGMVSTPAMFMSTVTEGFKYDGAIMITASHLPYNRNGLKFFTNEGGLEKQDIMEILTEAENGGFNYSENANSVQEVDFISVYAKLLRYKIVNEVNHPEHREKPLSGFKIVVDAGNGAGGFFAEKVLIPLGTDISGSQFLEPDGSFPNHIPNPEDRKAIESVSQAVVKNKADFGIIFDADVDRAGAVESSGKEINRNRLIALISAIVLENHPGSTIVTDSVTSTGLKKFIEENLGGIHHRFKRGYRNVIDEAIRLNSIGQESHLAIETSGHGALKENYFLDDGAYLVTKILIKMAKLKLHGKTIESLINGMPEPSESKEFRLNISVEDFKGYGSRVISELSSFASGQESWHIAPDNHEGIRISFDKNDGDGWFLLRLSLHDPLMPLNVESDSPGGVKIITSKIYYFLKNYSELDTSSLRSYLEV
jgi:Phosphomannomutase